MTCWTWASCLYPTLLLIYTDNPDIILRPVEKVMRQILWIVGVMALLLVLFACDDEEAGGSGDDDGQLRDAATHSADTGTPDGVTDPSPDETVDLISDLSPDDSPDAIPDETPDETFDALLDVLAADETPDIAVDETPDIAVDAIPDIAVDETAVEDTTGSAVCGELVEATREMSVAGAIEASGNHYLVCGALSEEGTCRDLTSLPDSFIEQTIGNPWGDPFCWWYAEPVCGPETTISDRCCYEFVFEAILCA